MADVDVVRLVVPARPEFLRLARVTAAGLAGRLGFVYDEVEDVRLAVDEMCFGAVGSRGREGAMEILFRASPDKLVIEGRGRFEGSGSPPGLNDLSRLVLAAVADEHELTTRDGDVEFRIVKSHSHRAAGA